MTEAQTNYETLMASNKEIENSRYNNTSTKNNQSRRLVSFGIDGFFTLGNSLVVKE